MVVWLSVRVGRALTLGTAASSEGIPGGPLDSEPSGLAVRVGCESPGS